MRGRSRLLDQVLKVLRASVYNNSVGAADANDNVAEMAKVLRAPVYNNSLREI